MIRHIAPSHLQNVSCKFSWDLQETSTNRALAGTALCILGLSKLEAQDAPGMLTARVCPEESHHTARSCIVPAGEVLLWLVCWWTSLAHVC